MARAVRQSYHARPVSYLDCTAKSAVLDAMPKQLPPADDEQADWQIVTARCVCACPCTSVRTAAIAPSQACSVSSDCVLATFYRQEHIAR